MRKQYINSDGQLFEIVEDSKNSHHSETQARSKFNPFGYQLNRLVKATKKMTKKE